MRFVCLLMAWPMLGADVLALRGLDPVRLTQGAEVAGVEGLAETRAGFVYRFSSEETRGAFRRDPGRYSIQLDGACGKMGPASGKGSPERWFVHEGRIYVFASDGCRRGFVANPAGHLDRVESAPAFGDREGREGRELVEKAARRMGGDWQALHVRWETDEEKKKHAFVGRGYWFRFPGAMRRDDEYLEWGAESLRVNGDRDAVVTPSSSQAMTASGREVVVRDLAVELVPLLRARRERGFVAWKAGEGKVGVVYRGAMRMLEMDGSGEVRKVTYRGRGPGGPFGEVVEVYSDYRKVDGLRLPHRVETTLDGKGWVSRSMRVVQVEVNGRMGDEVFAGRD